MTTGPVGHASAPGKVILLGEHAVVYGEPSLSLALERRIHVDAEVAERASTVNGHALDPARHGYIHHAIQLCALATPVRLQTRSNLPSASGIGSSAALSVATVAALLQLAGRAADPATVARLAFETEYQTQGAASPNDTTISTAGGAVLLSPRPLPLGEALWRLERDGHQWNAHRLHLPLLPLVLGNSGQRARTGDQVAKVRRSVERSGFARDAIREIGTLTLDAVQALQARDLVTLGRLMDRNHTLLHTLGVDTPQLARLVEAARQVPGTYGAKLTGAGGGGSIVALTEDPERVRQVLESHGAQSFVVTASPRGLEVTP